MTGRHKMNNVQSMLPLERQRVMPLYMNPHRGSLESYIRFDESFKVIANSRSVLAAAYMRGDLHTMEFDFHGPTTEEPEKMILMAESANCNDMVVSDAMHILDRDQTEWLYDERKAHYCTDSDFFLAVTEPNGGWRVQPGWILLRDSRSNFSTVDAFYLWIRRSINWFKTHDQSIKRIEETRKVGFGQIKTMGELLNV